MLDKQDNLFTQVKLNIAVQVANIVHWFSIQAKECISGFNTSSGRR